MENKALLSLLRPTSGEKRSKSAASGFLRMLKIFPALTSSCKMVALLSRPRRPLLADTAAATGTIFGHRKGRVTLAIQDNPHCAPAFIIELPMPTLSFHKEMATDTVRIALESETRTAKKRVMEEFVWAMFCNGRKMGYAIRRKTLSDDEVHVMQLLRGVSMGAGVLPPPPSDNIKVVAAEAEGEVTYMRARFKRVVGSKDSETLYMISPDGSAGPDLSIFFLRAP